MKTQDQIFGRLNYSIYRKNLEEVWKILEQYPKNCRKIFLKNIKTLEFKNLSIEKLQQISEDLDVDGLYQPKENKIYLNGFKNEQTEINHELFHVSSCTPEYWGVMVEVTIDNMTKSIGENLNEGITQYLAELSTNAKNQTNSAYQLEVFVIESLISIYGKEILRPYFQNRPTKFYSQFKSDAYKIIKLDLLLKKISKRVDTRNTFEEYILLKDLSPNRLKENNLYIETNKIKELNKHLKSNEFEINRLYEEVELEERKKENESQLYALKEDKNKEIYFKWYKEYTQNQKEAFDKIIKTIIILSRKHNMNDEEIKNMLIEKIKNKGEILDTIEYKNKKLIRK